MKPTTCSENPTIFDQAAAVFSGWKDPETGARVLRIIPKNIKHTPGCLSTCYHQHPCFLEGGRKVMLRGTAPVLPGASSTCVVDLSTGLAEPILTPTMHVKEVIDSTRMAVGYTHGSGTRAFIWDLRAGRELASMEIGDWILNSINFLSDGLRAMVFLHKGHPYAEKVHSRHYLLAPGEKPRLTLDLDRHFCSHIVGCPIDKDLYTYDRWLSPPGHLDQAITIRSLDGSFEEPVKLDANAGRPGNMWGCRDHYVWTPDGKRIVSYYCPKPITFNPLMKDNPEFNHFKLEWWLSALDWRTGNDLAACYPTDRWNGHMQVTPDSRYIVCGGYGYNKMLAIDIEALRNGWNEKVICSFPAIESTGQNHGPFPYPFVLPDYSGVLFNAGWPGPDHGVYLAEWPAGIERAM